MAEVVRSAQCVWSGDLLGGEGTLTVGSGAVGSQPVTWTSRAKKPEGRTSPEELLAAAHATCFAMVLATVLGQRSAIASSSSSRQRAPSSWRERPGLQPWTHTCEA